MKMMQFFILGRNPQLSRAEILAFLDARSLCYKEILFRANYLILDLNEEINIQELGGTIKSGTILFSGAREEIKGFISRNELSDREKFTFAVFGNIGEEILISKFKKEKRKALIRRGRKKLKLQRRDYMQIANADVEFFIYKEDKYYFGTVTQKYSYKEIEKRDMKKPVRREGLAISPRLAKILINLSGAKPDSLFLDPFCGIGGILQEALIKKINCFGIDSDLKAIEDAKKNLKWLKNNYDIKNEYSLLNADARQCPDMNFDAVATEPPLGELARKRPDNKKAGEIIKNFESFIIPVLQRLKKVKKPKARIAITFPFVRNFSVNLNKICSQAGLSLLLDIKEYREKQFISRQITVFE